MSAAVIFNHTGDKAVLPGSFWGQEGWWRPPDGWTYDLANMFVYDTSGRRFVLKYNENSLLVFQDPLREIM